MNFSLSIHPLDGLIVLGYLAAVLLFGLWMGRGQRTSADYFLAGRSLPWAVLLLSIVATETSTVTFLSLPGLAAAANGNLTFVQITFGYILGRLLIIWVLLPLYFKGQLFTAYEVLESRFGALSRKAASLLFLATRNVSDALRLFLTALVLQFVLGMDMAISIMVLGTITIVYTLVGGARSVIWNDCLQFVIYMIGALVAGVLIIRDLPGGMAQLMSFASESDKLRFLDFDFDLFKPSMTLWAGMVGGAFLTAATHGTDQLMVQRYLSARNQSDAARGLALSGFIVAFQFALFLLIGVGLAAFYSLAVDEGTLAVSSGDQMFAHFIVNYVPIGLAGMTLAAVFAAAMSTLSSSLNSSATALINDVYLPLHRSPMSEVQKLKAGRIATLVFGIIQVAIAIVVGQLDLNESTVSNVLKIAGFASGPVLGLYLLAVFAPQVGQRPAIAGFLAGVTVLSIVATGTALYWPWYAALGSLTTMMAGIVFGLLFRGVRTD